MLPAERFAAGDFGWRAHRAAFLAGVHASLAAYADAGLILRHILDDRRWQRGVRILFAREVISGRSTWGKADDLELRSEEGVARNVTQILAGSRAEYRASSFG